MMKSRVLWIMITGFVFLLASCASTAHIEKDETADFSRYKTFAWLDKEADGKKERNRNNDLAEQKIKEAVTGELQRSAGWKETKNKPDLLLSYDVLIERSLREEMDPVYSSPFIRTFFNPNTRRFFNVYYPSQFLGYDRDQRPVREGTITITMIDAKTDKTVWQGWTTDEVNNRNLSSRDIQQSVKSIFRKFDVAKN